MFSAEASDRSSGPGAAAKRYISFSCQCSCMRMPRISGIERLPLQRLGRHRRRAGRHSRRWRAASHAASATPCTQATSSTAPVLGPVGLDIDRFLDARAGDVGQELLDRIVAPDRLVGTEDARHHRPLQPWQIGLAPDVVMGVDDADHCLRFAGAAGKRRRPRRAAAFSTAGSLRSKRSSAGRSLPSASASSTGRMPAMARVSGR